MQEIPENIDMSGSDDDSVSMLDPDATLVRALIQASTGYSSEKLRAMAWLRLYSPRTYVRVVDMVTKYQLNMSPGGVRNMTKALEARAMREMQTIKIQGGKKGGE